MKTRNTHSFHCLALAAMLLCMGQAQAIERPSGGDATELRSSASGVGHMLVVPYYSTQGGNATLLSLMNTDEVNGKAVKLRFRGALNGDSVFSMQVFLAPGDMWTANISQNASGLSFVTTEDGSCTKPGRAVINSTAFSQARLNPYVTPAIRAAGTREGYVEVITMADIPPAATGVYPLIKPGSSGAATCTDIAGNTSWSGLDVQLDTVAAYVSLGLTPPTTGLAANWTIMNVPAALSWSGAAASLEATKGGKPAKAHLIYFPETTQPVMSPASLSADPLYTGTPAVIAPTMSDLPDLSTPYFVDSANPATQASAIASLWSKDSVLNEYWTEAVISASTDFTLTAPTKRFAVAVKYGAGTSSSMVFNSKVSAHYSAANTSLKNGAACVSALSEKVRSREGVDVPFGEVVITGPKYEPPVICGVATVLSINEIYQSKSDTLSAAVALTGTDAGYSNGRYRLNTGAADRPGLPLLGSAFVRAFNPVVSDGVAGHFSVAWPHRYLKNAN